MTETQPVDLTAFMAAAEYAILQAPRGTDNEASESLISAGCYYAPRLLAAVEAVLARHGPVNSTASGGRLVCAECADESGERVTWPCSTVAAICGALLGDTS